MTAPGAAGSIPPSLPNTNNVILIGYRGCGKSAVGQFVADRLGWPLVDTDRLIEAAAGHSIRTIFADSGEAAFRALETEQVARVAQATHQVISVGGGAVLDLRNRDALAAAGVCFWLTAPAEVLYERMQADARNADTRPALTDRTALDEVRHLLQERQPLYAALAQHVVQTAGRSVSQVAADILGLLAQHDASAETR